MMIAMVVYVSACANFSTTREGAAEDSPPVTTKATGHSKDLAPVLEPIRQKNKLPALAGAIVSGRRLAAIGAVGVRRYGDETPVTVDDRWHIGSCTKAMTATLAGTFVDEGKLAWSTTLGDVFPELRERMHPDYRGVTLEQLLSHRAGVPEDLGADGLWLRLWTRTGTPTEQRIQLLEGVLFKPPLYTPGEKYVYANGGYAIAGAMLEKLAGRSWEELMRGRVFDPLGMVSAGFGAPGGEDKLDDPQGHVARLLRKPRPIPPGPDADNPPAIGPAGIVHCSIGDWAKFAADQVAGARGSGRLLKPATYRKIQTEVGDDYALGWVVAQREWGGQVLMHGGSNTMWFAVVWLAPEKDFAVLVCTNLGGDKAAKAADSAAGALIQHHQNSAQPASTAPSRTDE